MERLTLGKDDFWIRFSDAERLINSYTYCPEYAKNECANAITMLETRYDTTKHIEELLEAEEQGRLVVLPCKIGDTVYSRYLDCEKPYRRSNCTDWKTDDDIANGVSCEKCPHRTPIALDRPFRWDDIPLFGKSVFLTPEEAESPPRKEQDCGTD